jgi:hypothetical protein
MALTVVLEADAATVVASATVAKYVDKSAGTDGDGSLGSPWNTLDGKGATLNAVVGSVAVVVSGLLDGVDIAGESWDNTDGTTLSFVSWHLLDAGKARGEWTPCVALSRLASTNPVGNENAVEFDLSGIIAKLDARGWSGTFGVSTVVRNLDIAGTVAKSVPTSGLPTNADELIVDDATLEAYRVTEPEVAMTNRASIADVAGTAESAWFDAATGKLYARGSLGGEAPGVGIETEWLAALYDDSSVAVFTALGWDRVDLLGLRPALHVNTGAKRFFSLNASRVLVQDCEFVLAGGDDLVACVNGGGAASGYTGRRNQYIGLGTDGGPATVFGGGTNYATMLVEHVVSHGGLRLLRHDGVDTGLLGDSAPYLGAAHSGGVDECEARFFLALSYNGSSRRLVQFSSPTTPTDVRDPSDFAALVRDGRAEDVSGVHVLNSVNNVHWLRVAFRGSTSGDHHFGHACGPAGRRAGDHLFQFCIFDSSRSIRGLLAFAREDRVALDRCTFFGQQSQLAAYASAAIWTGEVYLRRCLFLGASSGRWWWALAQSGNVNPPAVAGSILDWDGGTAIDVAFNANISDYRNTVDPTDATVGDLATTFPGSTVVAGVSLAPGDVGTTSPSDFDIAGLGTVQSVRTPIAGALAINGQADDGSLGAFQYGGAPGGATISSSRRRRR